MKFGLDTHQYQFLKSVLADPLEKKGAKIWCFGSRARGDAHPFSDLDIMVEADVDLADDIGRIKEELTRGSFPYKVDIVQLRDFAKDYLPGFHADKVEF